MRLSPQSRNCSNWKARDMFSTTSLKCASSEKHNLNSNQPLPRQPIMPLPTNSHGPVATKFSANSSIVKRHIPGCTLCVVSNNLKTPRGSGESQNPAPPALFSSPRFARQASHISFANSPSSCICFVYCQTSRIGRLTASRDPRSPWPARNCRRYELHNSIRDTHCYDPRHRPPDAAFDSAMDRE